MFEVQVVSLAIGIVIGAMFVSALIVCLVLVVAWRFAENKAEEE